MRIVFETIALVLGLSLGAILFVAGMRSIVGDNTANRICAEAHFKAIKLESCTKND